MLKYASNEIHKTHEVNTGAEDVHTGPECAPETTLLRNPRASNECTADYLSWYSPCEGRPTRPVQFRVMQLETNSINNGRVVTEIKLAV